MGLQLAKNKEDDDFKVGWKTKTVLTIIISAMIIYFFGIPGAHAAETTELIAEADIQQLKSLIIGCLSFITVIGTAYLTVLVGISAFTMIRKVIRG